MRRLLPVMLVVAVGFCLISSGAVRAAEGGSEVGPAEVEAAPAPTEPEAVSATEAEEPAEASPTVEVPIAPEDSAAEPAAPVEPVEEEPAAPTEAAAPVEEEAVTPEPEPAVVRELVPPPVAGVEVVGNQNIPTEEILAAVESRVGSPYSEAQVAQDRRSVVRLGWFATVAVERESVEGGVRLIFRVFENPVISDIQFEGVGEVTQEELLEVMETRSGSVYNTPRLARDAQVIEELYRSRGFILALVVEPRMSPDGVLTLAIAEGVIEEIRISGNTHTKTNVIRRYIRTRVGDTYNDEKVAKDVMRLTNLGYFETVRRDAEIGTEPGQVILVFTVVEKRRTGMASVGGGYSSVQGLVWFVDLMKTNLGGTGQMATLRGEFGGRTSYELGYRHPWVMTPETRLSLGLYDRLILREAYVTDELGEQRSILYDERRSGGNLTLGRPLSDRATIYVGVRADDVSISGLTEEEEPFLAGTAFLPRAVRSLTMAAVIDGRDNVYNPRRDPTSGTYHQFSMEFAGVFGGVEFKKYTVDTRRYIPVGDRNVIALRILAGTTSGDAPYLEQFLIGGSESLRGYRTDRFAGARMAILNGEYRFPLSGNLLGVVFVDVGDAWGGDIASDPFFGGDESFTAHMGYGVGVRVKTPIGPIRLDLGFGEEGTETHFGVSHMF